MFQRIPKSAAARLALGIDIGLYAIKAILLEETVEGLAVRHAARVMTPPNAVKDGIVVGRREVAARLRQIVRQSGCRIGAASLSIPTEQALVRWIDLPRMDHENLRAATRFEARKYLPYPVDHAEVEIVPMEQAGAEEEGRMRALLAAAPRAVVRSHAETLEMAGLEVASVELEPLALLRAQNAPHVQQGALWRGQPIAYVQLGEESSGMCVVQDMNLRFVRAISWGGVRLTQALVTALGCTAEEAQAIKEQDDATLDENGRFSWSEGEARRETDAMGAELERLHREIQRLLNYYRSLFPERSYEGILDRVILCGGTADLDGLARYFAKTLQVEVMVRNPFHSLASRLSSGGFKAIEGRGASFVVAIGLALGELQAAQRAERSRSRGSGEFIWRRKAA